MVYASFKKGYKPKFTKIIPLILSHQIIYNLRSSVSPTQFIYLKTNLHFISMKKLPLLLPLLLSLNTFAQQKNIYYKGWVDFNKNGKMDVFEDPSQPIDKRINDLLGQMTVDEKTCQLATLYGYKRVLKEEMPAESWKNEIWKMASQILMRN